MMIAWMRLLLFSRIAATVLVFISASCLSEPLNAQTNCSAENCPEEISGMQRDILQQRLNRSIATEPDSGRISQRLNSRGWDPNANGGVPVLVAPADNDAKLSTSASQWSAYLLQQDIRKIDDLNVLAPNKFKSPAYTPLLNRNIDIWGVTTLDGLGDDATRHGYASHFGADYTLDRSLLFGVMVEFEDANQSGSAWDGARAEATSYMAGPYIATRLTDHLRLKARAAWGESNDLIDAEGVEGDFTGERSVAKAGLEGYWQVDDWQLSPNTAFVFARETSTDANGSDVSKSNLSIRPEIRRTLRLGNGQVAQPFVNYRTTLDIDAIEGLADAEDLNLTGTIGGGVSLSKQDEYTIRATTDILGVGDTDTDPTLKSRVEVNLPLE